MLATILVTRLNLFRIRITRTREIMVSRAYNTHTHIPMPHTPEPNHVQRRHIPFCALDIGRSLIQSMYTLMKYVPGGCVAVWPYGRMLSDLGPMIGHLLLPHPLTSPTTHIFLPISRSPVLLSHVPHTTTSIVYFGHGSETKSPQVIKKI